MNNNLNTNVSDETLNPRFCKAAVSGCPSSELYNMDCIAGMKHYPDKYFDIAICDPPYNIDNKKSISGYTDGCRMNTLMREMQEWDIRPNYEYFIELFRVSKNVIMWGGNYFTKDLPESRCWIVWNKDKYSFKHSDFEMAWTSFNTMTKKFEMINNSSGKIHPTQKPVKLYEWVLTNYAKPGDKILDTHVGSGSSRIAAYKHGFDYVGFEIDKDYFEAQEKRFNEFKAQLTLF